MNYEIITPVVTAFDRRGRIDYKANEEIIDFLIDGGVNGILVLGSSGEFTELAFQEKKDFFDFYSEYVDGRLDLYAGTGSMKLKETVELSNYVSKRDYKGSFIIGPYYYGQDQEKLLTYYNKLAKSIDGNIYIYNFPDRTGHSLSHDTIKQLADMNSNIKGLKDSVTEPGHTNLCILATKENNFDVYSGFDDHYLYNIAAGGKGCISALSNIAPELWSSLVKSSNEGDFENTIRLQSLVHELMPLYNMDSNFSYLFKRLMIYRGLNFEPKSIFPFDQLDEEVFVKAKRILDTVLAKFREIDYK
ncbi:MAG TPA: dihydrodipicolinate synthase family protein [Tissierellaceae bacterium]|nr:dihydrodipicolinate synthase family protein [Tissierellaceae bacterium]